MKQIPLTQGQFALVDDEDYDYINQWKWYINHKKGTNGTIYAVRNLQKNEEGYVYGKRQKVKMHRFILRCCDKNIIVDHKDRNGLNNQKSNLRTCTISQNTRNTIPKGASRFMGVHRCPWSKNKWMASIRVHGKKIMLGSFLTEEEAAKAYDKAAKELDPHFAYINFK